MRGRMGTQGSPVKSYDYLLKFLLVGDSDVGKGEILESLQDGASESPYAYSNVTTIAASPWSRDQNSDAWQLIHLYDGYNVPVSPNQGESQPRTFLTEQLASGTACLQKR